MNPICRATVTVPRNYFPISSLNLFLVICMLEHPWLLFSSLVFTHLIHFQTANTSHFCFCFVKLNKSFPSISYCKAGSLSHADLSHRPLLHLPVLILLASRRVTRNICGISIKIHNLKTGRKKDRF